MYVLYQVFEGCFFFYYLLVGFILTVVESILFERFSFFVSKHIMQIVSHWCHANMVQRPNTLTQYVTLFIIELIVPQVCVC